MTHQKAESISRAIAAELAMDSAHIPLIQAIIIKHLVFAIDRDTITPVPDGPQEGMLNASRCKASLPL